MYFLNWGVKGLPFHSQEWSMSSFPCSLTRNITPHSMENLAFHSLLRWNMIILPILTTSPIHFPLGKLGECPFCTWERLKLSSTYRWSVLSVFSIYARFSWRTLALERIQQDAFRKHQTRSELVESVCKVTGNPPLQDGVNLPTTNI